MGTWTMTSQSGDGGVSAIAVSTSSGQRPLARQGSMYGLTLGEVQSHLGEPLLSMNLDDLVRSVLAADGTNYDAATSAPAEGGLQRQGSLTMPIGLSKKTVDEVWKGIQHGPGMEVNGQDEGSLRQERQQTFGEMTLEDFLLKAGVVTQGYLENVDPEVPEPQQGSQWFQQYQMVPVDGQGQSGITGRYLGNSMRQPLGVSVSSLLDSVYADGQMCAGSPLAGALPDQQMHGRKRTAPSGEPVDKVVERRQKRMIKNRESAARSRARKQAYTNELENKVSRLEEENDKLRKQRMLDTILFSAPLPAPKFQLRRTSSSLF